jgi:hypothetical protein
LEGRQLDGRLGYFLTAAAWAIGLCNHTYHAMTGRDQGFKRWHGELRRAEKHHAEGAGALL